MTSVAEPLAGHDPPGEIPLLPERPRHAGPVTAALLRRMVLTVAVIEVAGAVLLVAGGRIASIVGASLVIPGGGLLATGHVVLFLATAAAVVLAIVLWWALSATWGIPAVWVASGVLAVVLGDAVRWWGVVATYAVAAACVIAPAWTFERRFRTKRARVVDLNEYLRTTTVPQPSTPLRTPDDTDAELLRWCYELALQPLDEFVGFEWGDQFHGGTCVRYQLNFLGWGLAAYAVNYVPNAPQPMEEVLRNLVLKQTDLRVWSYWRTLNLIGNLDANPDPLIRDNIMFSGFTGDQLNMYEAATGSTRFDEPGSLTFVWKDGRTFAYDHHSWMEAVHRNFAASRLGFFPCEPGWAFAACNTFGAQALLGYDRLHGTTLWGDLEDRWRTTLLDEYLMPDGNYANIRCTRTGLSWDTGEVDGGEYPVTGTNMFVDVAPDLALRGRAVAVRSAAAKLPFLAAMVGDDDELEMELPEVWERNRARKTTLGDWSRIVAGARMLGDERLAAAAQRAAERQSATGERWPDRPMAGGVQTVAQHLIIRWQTPMSLGELNLRGYEPPAGPLVTSAPWPDVLVTEARSSDGRSLDLEVRGVQRSAGEHVALGFGQLDPLRRYVLAVDGDPVAVVPDAAGRATASVRLAAGATRCRLDVAEEVLS